MALHKRAAAAPKGMLKSFGAFNSGTSKRKRSVKKRASGKRRAGAKSAKRKMSAKQRKFFGKRKRTKK